MCITTPSWLFSSYPRVILSPPKPDAFPLLFRWPVPAYSDATGWQRRGPSLPSSHLLFFPYPAHHHSPCSVFLEHRWPGHSRSHLTPAVLLLTKVSSSNVCQPKHHSEDKESCRLLEFWWAFCHCFGFGGFRRPIVATGQLLLDHGRVLLHLSQPRGSLTKLAWSPFLLAVSFTQNCHRRLCFPATCRNRGRQPLLGQPVPPSSSCWDYQRPALPPFPCCLAACCMCCSPTATAVLSRYLVLSTTTLGITGLNLIVLYFVMCERTRWLEWIVELHNGVWISYLDFDELVWLIIIVIMKCDENACEWFIWVSNDLINSVCSLNVNWYYHLDLGSKV